MRTANREPEPSRASGCTSRDMLRSDTSTGGIPMQANNIDQVLQMLASIIEEAKARDSRFGFFAALYRQVTLEVQRGIERGFFDDGPRMERFDTVFANRYLAALDAWQSGGTPTRSWKVAFTAME